MAAICISKPMRTGRWGLRDWKNNYLKEITFNHCSWWLAHQSKQQLLLTAQLSYTWYESVVKRPQSLWILFSPLSDSPWVGTGDLEQGKWCSERYAVNLSMAGHWDSGRAVSFWEKFPSWQMGVCWQSPTPFQGVCLKKMLGLWSRRFLFSESHSKMMVGPKGWVHPLPHPGQGHSSYEPFEPSPALWPPGRQIQPFSVKEDPTVRLDGLRNSNWGWGWEEGELERGNQLGFKILFSKS